MAKKPKVQRIQVVNVKVEMEVEVEVETGSERKAERIARKLVEKLDVHRSEARKAGALSVMTYDPEILNVDINEEIDETY